MKMKELLLAFAALIAPLAANASTVTYDFTALATSGPYSGASFTGAFTYDTSVVPPGVTASGTNIFSSATFSWVSGIYSTGSPSPFQIATGSVGTASDGRLSSVSFGDNCILGRCFVTPPGNDWVVLLSSGSNVGTFVYVAPSSPNVWGGTVTFQAVAPVPLPAAAWLMLSGLGGIGVMARKRKDAGASSLSRSFCN